MPLLATPATVTTTLPDLALLGTVVTIRVLDQLDAVAALPLKVTVLVPLLLPKPLPLIVTDVPIRARVGDSDVIFGAAAAATVNVTPLLATPLAVTITAPVVAPEGTFATMLVVDQLVGVAVVPLNLTVLVPCVVPKFVPAIVTVVPIAPLVGDKEVIVGADVETVNVTPLLDTPPAVTVTAPVVVPVGTLATMLVDDQLVGVAVVPLNFTVLVPCVVPKFAPAIVTVVPIAPLVGDKDVIVGAVVVTVNVAPLLAVPPTVTTTDPLVAPAGTFATMLVADQLVGVAVVLLNVTVLVP
ncbi:MAG TPA: hypothetical protein VGG73_15565 [Vicinamibacterales bacterium]|jgi:hypothetical protein